MNGQCLSHSSVTRNNFPRKSDANHLRTIDFKTSLFLLCLIFVVNTEGFGQGTMIENNFESTYCRDDVSALSRGPVHYDLQRCGGQCTARRAPRDMYRMLVNTTTYSVDNVQVDIRANARRGANILGFAVVAITEDGGTAGRWVVDEDAEEPEVLRATCDSLLEGQVIFQAQPSSERTSVRLVWNPRKTNFGKVIFRAWIVQSIDAIFVVDSSPLTNPLDGREFMSIENHFRELLDSMVVENQPQRRPSPSSQRLPNSPRRNTGTGRRNLPRDRINTNGRFPQAATDNNGASRLNASSASKNGKTQREMTNSGTFTMDHFEDAFLARMASGFDLSAPDPFSDFEKETYQMSDLIPHHVTFPREERGQNLGSGRLNSRKNQSNSSNSNATRAGSRSTERNHTSNGNTDTSRPSEDQSDQRSPRQQDIPSQADSTSVPQPTSATADDMTSQTQPPIGSRIPSQVISSPILVQQPNSMNTIRLAPGNPFSRFQPNFGQNQFQRNLPSPIANSAFFGINNNPVFANGVSRQALPGTRGRFGGNMNVSPGSNFLPGFNAPFMPQSRFNQWMPNWNSRPNWGFQNGGGSSREFMPGWNSGQNLAGWNSNLAGPGGNPFRSNFNFNTGPSRISPNMNFNTRPTPGQSAPPRSTFSGFQQIPFRPNTNFANNVGPVVPQANSDNNPVPSTDGNGSPDSMGSFSDFFHAVGGWGRR